MNCKGQLAESIPRILTRPDRVGNEREGCTSILRIQAKLGKKSDSSRGPAVGRADPPDLEIGPRENRILAQRRQPKHVIHDLVHISPSHVLLLCNLTSSHVINFYV